jgi:o-succinylbenzoate---CoA ligase
MPIQFITNNQSIIDNVNSFVDEWHTGNTFIEVQTSGSTGSPKTIKLSKSYMKASAIATGTHLGLKSGDSSLLCLSTDTIGGRMMIVRSIVLGLKLFVADVSSTPLVNLENEIDFAAMVPLQVEGCLENKPSKLDFIKKLIIGGAPVNKLLIKSLTSFKGQAFHTFGMTETISHIAMRSLNKPLEESFSTLPGISVSTTQDKTLVIDAPEIGVHELNTNDIVELRSEHNFKWLGRSDFVINSGGIKIHPEEIESLLAELISQPFFIGSTNDEKLGRKLILHLECVNTDLTKDQLVACLGNIKSPKEIHLHQKFSYTASGKLDRNTTLKAQDRVTRKVL